MARRPTYTTARNPRKKVVPSLLGVSSVFQPRGTYSKAQRPEVAVQGGNVVSSAIDNIDYDPRTAQLTVTFNSGRRYAYFGVSPQRYRAFMAAPSKGQYLNYSIKGQYSYRQI
jgi:hypothetical protein